MKRLIIDTDTASDDAIALVMALSDPDVRVEALTVVAGNVPLDQAVQNALYTVELCGADVPVHAGLARPMLVEPSLAQVHGEDGMGDIGLPLAGRTPAPGHGVDVLIETIQRFAGDITLVALGPLTNVAVALLREPAIAQAVSRCVVMGGSADGTGNVTPVAEFNIHGDPHAAKVVFDSGIPLTMVGIDISRNHAELTDDEVAGLRSLGTPVARFCADIQRTSREFSRRVAVAPDLPDPIAMAVVLDPEVATDVGALPVEVIVDEGACRGQTVVDHLRVTDRKPNVHVVRAASGERFRQLLWAAVRDGSPARSGERAPGEAIRR